MPRTFILVVLITSSLASAQEPSQDTTLQTLLKEVHALRIAMEHSNQIAPKVQIALARMQVQEERVRNANRQLQDARNRVRDFENKQAEVSDRIKQTEAQQAQTVDPNTRKQMDMDIQASKAELAQLSKLEQQSQAQEAEASSQLLNEQAKWNEVNDLLTSIERMLAPVQP
jgi:predicted  nucleic acid-binding Zn-ribbon protein